MQDSEIVLPWGRGKDILQQDYVSLNLFESILGMSDRILLCLMVESIVNKWMSINIMFQKDQ